MARDDYLTTDVFFFFQAEDGIRDYKVTGVQTCALPISYTIPLSICARITSGFTARPQSTAHMTRSTRQEPSRLTVTSATCATTVLNDSCTAIPRPRDRKSVCRERV